MRPDVRRWFDRRTYAGTDVPGVDVLFSHKAGQTVSVVLPARNEAATVGGVVGAVAPLVRAGLVDELVVLDDSSTDSTAAVAAAAGASVVPLGEVLPAYGLRHGKGEALWKGLHVTDGDVVVYLDTDLVGVTPQWVTGLLWPLLTDDGISFVKGCYERPLLLAGQSLPGGGRVTELTARPLLDLLWPQLAGVVQPLGGEYAARRELLEQLPYDAGYAVELGLLLDAVGVIGLDGLAQVYLGLRQHRNQDTEALGRMAAGITAAALQRAGIDLPGGELVQFRTGNGRPQPHEVPLAQEARPPLVSIPEYAARRARAS